MNRILEQVEQEMHACLRSALPDVRPADLEKDGAVFYMNGKNGTAFDWYVNDHLSDFFIFYNDKENLGAVKAMLFGDGALLVYVFGEKGRSEPVRFDRQVAASAEELLELAVTLTGQADDKRRWDEAMRALETDGRPDKQAVEAFLDQRDAYAPLIEQKRLYGKSALVSRKVREGGWKIGFGMRDEPTREGDSGWFFSVGDETEEYVNDPENLELWAVGSALRYDPALAEFITAPYGTAIVRVSSDAFALDEPGVSIFIEKK